LETRLLPLLKGREPEIVNFVRFESRLYFIQTPINHIDRQSKLVACTRRRWSHGAESVGEVARKPLDAENL
jgi:hypothetical protein